ncbi:unnamed protein product [Phytomonas sp. Hart1]|nr:unnamed protein product [Phytomonas sp. Hart1]|eukprot:CCW67110.1 unnamed protein product [Phytomonas sp. isolate Hart1]
MATNPDIETDISYEIFTFFRNLNNAVEYCDASALHDLYEIQFEALTKKHYIIGPGQTRPWPSLRLKVVSDNFKTKIAEQVYSFIYYKHLFTDRAAKLQDAKVSWATFSDLFAAIADGYFELPSWMLWDVFDEFIYQMTVVYQKRFSTRSEWTLAETFSIMDRVIEKSGIIPLMSQPNIIEDLTKDGNTRVLGGFFAIITRSKLNVLLGSYFDALSDLQPLDIFGVGRSVLQKVTPAYISLLYNVGFSYLMIHRYEDASNNFRRCLAVKSSGRKFSERLQLDAAYMFVCSRVLGGMLITNVSSYLDPRKLASFEDDKESLRLGDEERFRDVFDRCSPKFISVPPLATGVKGTEGKELQARMFRRAVQQQQEIIKLRGYFGVYQNTKMSLLETLLDTDDGYAPLFALKLRSRQLVHNGESPDLLSGDHKVSAQYDCIVSDDNVEVVPCVNFGGMEGKFFNKIKGLQRAQQKQAQRKQNQTRPRRDLGEGKPQQGERRRLQQKGGKGAQERGQNIRNPQQRRYNNTQHRAAPLSSDTNNLFNRNVEQ